MESEFRSELVEQAKAYVRLYASFQDIFMLANELLPEFVADQDTDAMRVASDIIMASEHESRRFKVAAAAIDALVARATRPVVMRLTKEDSAATTSNVIYSGRVAAV